MPENSLYNEYIDHEGTVIAIERNPVAGSLTATVRLEGTKECGGCPAARLCGVAEGESDTLQVVVPKREATRLRVGDHVTVRGTERMHHRAIMLATVLPCLALVAVMVGVYLLTRSQAFAALAGLGAMVVFFTILFMARNRVAHEFSFTVAASSRPVA
ncbi:MAG: SoxR reducing system RseC family protein [Muribaculaceae bacterium]|nr:SoxR reducing system RseC family protein [Muribaculaceae bacterium]